MGRTLKDGTWKPKPSASKKSERMSGPIRFEQAIRKGTLVKVFVGAGWEKCTVVEFKPDRVQCKAVRGGRTITCYDARNLEVTS